MAQFHIEIKYMALFYSDKGLTVLLPSSAHDARLIAGGVSTPLRSAEVRVLKDGGVAVGTKNVKRTATGFLHVDDVLTHWDPGHGLSDITPRSALLADPVGNWPELNARIVLPDGELTPIKPVQASKYGFRNTVVDAAGNKTTPVAVPLAYESMRYTIQMDAGSKYSIQVDSQTPINVTDGATIIIENADRPTWDTSPQDWFEMRHLFDLLTLVDLKYQYPSLDLGTKSSPENDPCSGLAAGTFSS